MADNQIAPGATDVRDVRETWPIAGIGGFLEVEWVSTTSFNSDGVFVPSSRVAKLEVERWELVHDYDNAELPLSGGNGSMSRFRVGDDWDFLCIVLLDMRPAKASGADNSFIGQPFLDGRLEGNPNILTNFHFALRLQVGDPAFWVNNNPISIAVPNVGLRQGMYYFCPRVLLRQTRTINDSRGNPPDGFVRALVRGEGAAPLERWIDNQVAVGGLGFPLTQKGVTPLTDEGEL